LILPVLYHAKGKKATDIRELFFKNQMFFTEEAKDCGKLKKIQKTPCYSDDFIV